MTAVVNGIETYFVARGRGDPVLCVHGFPLSGRLWSQLADGLQDDYRVIVPDLRGLGRSQSTESTSMAQFADDLNALLDHVGEDRPVVLVGLSMGGYVAFEFFRRHRARVRALVLADTKATADTEEAARNRTDTAAKVLREGSKVVADSMMDKLFGPAATGELRDNWRNVMASSDPRGVAAALLAMRDRVDSVPTLSRIDVPTLIVVGEHDSLTPPEDARQMHEAIPNARLAVVPDAGHMTPVEQPQAFNRAVREFLAAMGACRTMRYS